MPTFNAQNSGSIAARDTVFTSPCRSEYACSFTTEFTHVGATVAAVGGRKVGLYIGAELTRSEMWTEIDAG